MMVFYLIQSVKCTFEKRGQFLRTWVEPLEYEGPRPDSQPPVVELSLSLKNLVHGKEAKGSYAVYADYPCTSSSLFLA